MVDWSAAAKPATGADSIWVGVLKRNVRFQMAFEAHNPSTRAEAEKLLTEQKAAIADARREAGEMMRKNQLEVEKFREQLMARTRAEAEAAKEEAKRAILAEGCEIVEITPAEHQRFAQAVEPVIADYRRRFGDDVFTLVPEA